MLSVLWLLSIISSVPFFAKGDVETSTFYGVQGTGHPLIIKSFPAIDNIQSELYEVYMEPYTYDLRPKSAVAVVTGDGISGEITFFQKQPPAGVVTVTGSVTGLPPGRHGLHIHHAGDLRQGCNELGDHFDPFLLQHGGPKDSLRHVGDLGNIEVGDDGTSEFKIEDAFISLSGGPRSILGRGIVITENEDDLGRGGSAESVRNGSSGKPIACGVIAYVR
ncbi:superoxide dismutase [Cu-Zn]-like isoform X2 [Agrilus planipennis]|uniref:superoxide dismutase n=1 Tax=Agrilus planipennis TaxID=224129 RepID=A0A1W4XHS9_AGRPL|nr:superoxide dismutase [Cu-Zn] isoform X2 [Agrilus planipennis]XP_025835198.1 superoxide dismutase [Cu-Zn]-like isoform X2 [Agrilus planipennis]